MTLNSYASTRRDSQWTAATAAVRPALAGFKIVRARKIRYISRAGAQYKPDDRFNVAPAAGNVCRDHGRRRRGLFDSPWRRPARRERGIQRVVGGEARNRCNRANSHPARARKISFLLRRPSLLHEDFRAE